MRSSLPRIALPLGLSVSALLLLKYFWSMFAFPGVPFGYDAGIYRYLFIRKAEGLTWFLSEGLPNWAQSHAPGLFYLSSPLVAAGIPADWLIGWMWNLMPVVLAVALALVVRRKYGDAAALFTLVAALVSVVQYEGFLMMYWKVFAALLWCTLAFGFFERKSLWWMLFGLLTLVTHQQIGLVFALALVSSLISAHVLRKEKGTGRDAGLLLLVCAVAFALYLPTYRESLGKILPELLKSSTYMVIGVAIIGVAAFILLLQTLPLMRRRGLWILSAVCVIAIGAAFPVVTDAPEMVSRFLLQKSDVPGAFISLTDYLRLSLPLLLLGIAGLFRSTEKERGTPWQWAALWCAVAAFGMFFFYRRFLLPLDFFLLPFAGLALAALWNAGRAGRMTLTVLLVLQALLLLTHMKAIDPHVEKEWLREFAALESVVEPGSEFVVLDNMAPWIVGFLPDASVSGPGIFESRPLHEWESFLLGSDDDRRNFFSKYPKGTYFYASPVFVAYYPPDVQEVLTHPCLEEGGRKGLYRSVCGAWKARQ